MFEDRGPASEARRAGLRATLEVFRGGLLKFQTVRGTRDILPGEVEVWQEVEALTRDLFERYGFREIRTPIMEATDLFARGVGASTDIVKKEMFSFASGDDSLTLRPEMTASVVRAYIQHGLSRSGGAERLYYVGPMFRHERPQKGRQRQFHQIGVEVLGSDDPYVDAETIEMVMAFLQRVQVGAVTLVLNSVGCSACRPVFREALVRWLEEPEGVTGGSTSPVSSGTVLPTDAGSPPIRSAAVGTGDASSVTASSSGGSARRERLCADCQRRLVENPLRVFDCKVESDRILLRDAPTVLEHLCEACRTHFAGVRSHLDRLGIAYRIDPRLVRGLDYYVRTAFEVVAEEGLGAQNSLMGGGRYDGLVKELGGPDVPGFGWALGIERLLMLKEAAHGGVRSSSEDPASKSGLGGSDLFIAHLGDEAWAHAILLAKGLRARGYSVRIDPARGKLGPQLKRADREGARFALILGDDEIRRSVYQLKNMATQAQDTIEADPPEELATRLERHIGAPRSRRRFGNDPQGDLRAETN